MEEQIIENKNPLANYYWSYLCGIFIDYKTGNAAPNSTLKFIARQNEWNNTLIYPLKMASAAIYQATMTDEVNILIVPMDFVDIVNDITSFSYNPNNANEQSVLNGVYCGSFYGVLAGRNEVKVYKSNLLQNKLIIARINRTGMKAVLKKTQTAFNVVPEICMIHEPSLINTVQEYCVINILNK